jgi:adenine-specific DNA methylase
MGINNDYKAVINLLEERKATYEYKKRTKFIATLFRYGRNELTNCKSKYKQKVFTNMINFLKVKYIVRSFPEFHGIFELDVHSTLTRMLLNKDFERDIIPLFEIMLT